MLDTEQIRRILPHRYPFLLVDRILEIDPGKSAVGLKNVTCNEPFFQGHWPHKSVMPAVLLLESMAQVAGVMLLSMDNNAGKNPYFAGIDKSRFRKPVVPGDTLIISTKVLRLKTTFGRVFVEARVEGAVVAEAEMMFALAPDELEVAK